MYSDGSLDVLSALGFFKTHITSNSGENTTGLPFVLGMARIAPFKVMTVVGNIKFSFATKEKHYYSTSSLAASVIRNKAIF